MSAVVPWYKGSFQRISVVTVPKFTVLEAVSTVQLLADFKMHQCHPLKPLSNHCHFSLDSMSLSETDHIRELRDGRGLYQSLTMDLYLMCFDVGGTQLKDLIGIFIIVL